MSWQQPAQLNVVKLLSEHFDSIVCIDQEILC